MMWGAVMSHPRRGLVPRRTLLTAAPRWMPRGGAVHSLVSLASRAVPPQAREESDND